MTLPASIQLPRQQGVEQALGTGLGAAAGGTLANLLGQYQQQKQIKALSPILEQYGLNEEQINQLSKSGISPDKITNVLQLLGEQQQLQQFYQQDDQTPNQPYDLTGDETRLPADNRFSEQGLQQTNTMQDYQQNKQIKPEPYDETLQEENIEQSPRTSKPILASKQIFKPVKAKDIPDYQRNVMRAKEMAFNQNKEFLKELRESGNVAKENLPLVERGLNIVKRKGVGGLKGTLQEQIGKFLPFARSPDVREFQRIQKALTVGQFRKNFGARPAASEFFYITDIFGRPGDRKEALERSLLQEKWLLEIAKKKQEVTQNILNQTNGEVPLNLDELVSQKVQPLYDKFLKDSGYYDWKNQTLKKYKPQLRKNEVLMIYPDGTPSAVSKNEVREAQNQGAFLLQ
jgi:hypothetical protein